jgi:hypothetical protein
MKRTLKILSIMLVCAMLVTTLGISTAASGNVDLFNILETNPADWVSYPHEASGAEVKVEIAGGEAKFINVGGYWPNVTYMLPDIMSIPRSAWGNVTLYYDFTIGNAGTIALFNGPFESNEAFALAYILSGGNVDAGSNDGVAGTYKGSFLLHQIFAQTTRGTETVPFTGDSFDLSAVRVFAVNDDVTFREFRLVGPASLIPEPGSSGNDGSDGGSDLPSVAEANSWAQADVLAAYQAGMIPRDLMSNYRNPITRENFCRMAIAYVEYHSGMPIAAYLASKGLTPRAPFNDTSNPAVLAAAALGIVQGTDAEANLFSPNQVLVRADGAVMLANACKALGVDIDSSPQTVYADQADIRSWARSQINFVTEKEIMTGSNNLFSPAEPYQTQQAILTFFRIGQNVDF